ncbi:MULTISPECIES: sensor histidine kinase [Streptomyces]|uniref:HAMP domain-containing sensor histidine kinase n=1 Tax=Streptomyces TaxID=1883 RepID=UPI001903A06F|nr:MULTISPECIES: HAMP domain-containing sensor histidine kinase [unclassified Streptomyces]MCU4748387.1 HAMP domain-containing histidine kinase [Streptomyces sp. G-5]QQN78939.1 HAMP domain-containing histidine kinase [Streptomyces sp. XC 2026]
MRRRIIVALLPVLALLVVGIGISYAAVVSERTTQQVFIDRSGDAVRFANLAEAAIASGERTRLHAELDAYHELYDSPVWVLGLDGGLVHDPGPPPPDGAAVTEDIQRAFAGARATEAATVWPWQRGPLRVVEPVGRDSQVTAVVVIEAPTDGLRAASMRRWGVGAALLLVPVLALMGGLWPLTRWILRPVRDLERIAMDVRGGDLGARAPVEHGPPELRGLASSFNAMVDTVQRSLERQRMFVGDVAHQLRNPLAGLRLSVENLRPWVRQPPAREAVEDAVDGAVQMGEMFEAMLAATAAASRERVRDSEAWTLARVFATARPHWEAVTGEHGRTLRVEDPDPELVLRQPPGGLVAVLDELVDNAAWLSDGSTVTVHAFADADGRFGTVVVADDGTGLSAQEREAARGRFWRAARHQNIRGTGLGLAIIHDVVEDVGGEVRLEPNTPRGLRVAVRLPAVRRPGP